MKITKVIGREIYDSRGYPTVECQLILENDVTVRASVPSGLSKSSFEAVELRDGGERVLGLGVSKALANLENIIGPAIIGKHPEVVEMDLLLKDIDGTENKSKLGANAMLAASIAILRAKSVLEEIPPFELIARLCSYESVTVPYPMFNLINGGAHADTNFPIQEIMVLPIGHQSFRLCLETSIVLFHKLKELLKKNKKRIAIGDEGGFAANFSNVRAALDLVMEAITRVSLNNNESFALALDIAATQLYDKKTKKYSIDGKKLTTKKMIAFYKELISEYPIYAIEDGLAESDWQGWIDMTTELGEKVHIVGDDITATNPMRIIESLKDGVGDTVLIKPNQIGTVTETLQAIKLCKEYNRNIIISHRSGETIDTFIVDLAVGTSAGHIKAGGLCRGERLAKYNELLRVEDMLMLTLLGI